MKKLFAIVGVAISICSSIVLVFSTRFITPLPVDHAGTVSKSHSRTSHTIKDGFHGVVTVTEWIEEKWSWDAPGEIFVGDTGTLKVNAEIVKVRHTFGGPVDQGIDETNRIMLPDPVTVTAGGPFDWGGDSSMQSKTSPKNAPQPFEWQWVFTASEPGEKKILVELPPEDGRPKSKRVTESNSTSTETDSRFFEVPVSVGQKGLLSEFAVTFLMALAWLVGPAFTAPWLIWLIGRFRRREKSPLWLPGNK